jgi:hypothetical protein
MESLDLPSRREAVALATVGFTALLPKWHRNAKSGEMRLTWSLRTQCNQAQQLLAAVSDPLPAKNLATLSPEHPLLTCLYYQEIHAALLDWIRTGLTPLVVKSSRAGRLLRLAADQAPLRPSDLIPLAWGSGQRPTAAIADPSHAAVAILCGFVPYHTLDSSTGTPRILFAAESLTFPGLLLSHLQSATPASHLGTAPAGEHPACYALAAAANATDFASAESLAAQNPTHQYRGRGSRSALLSDAFLRPDSPAHYRDKLRSHLAAA